MHILAFNGSPRKKGNTSALVGAMLEGSRAAGADTTEVRLHDIHLKGCMGCLSCRQNPGFCKQEDDLSAYLEAMKTCTGYIVASPIYMFHITGQMKMLVDRNYSFYINRPEGGYDSALPAGKTFALVTSQGDADAGRFERPIRWLAGMTGGGHAVNEVGRIVQAGSALRPAWEDEPLLEEARRIGRLLVERAAS